MLPGSESLGIVYFTSQPAGTTYGVAGLLQQMGHRILLVVTTPGPARRPTTAYKDVVANHVPGLDILVTSHIGRLASIVRGLDPDLIFVTGFPRLLPAELLSVPRLGSINGHPALLPTYRGPDPLFWQIMNGETQGGLTIHRMDGEFDTGPILAQGTMPINEEDTIETVAERLLPLATTLIPRAIEAAIAGEPGTPQSKEGASYAPLRSEQDRLLDWNRPALYLHRQVRAWGSAGAIARIDGREWVVRRASVGQDGGGAPGSRVAPGVQPAVQTGEGVLVLEDAEPADATVAAE